MYLVYKKYHHFAEIWFEFKDGLQGQYETGKRLLSYVKPTERLFQVSIYY